MKFECSGFGLVGLEIGMFRGDKCHPVGYKRESKLWSGMAAIVATDKGGGEGQRRNRNL